MDYEAIKQFVLNYIGQLVLYGGGSVAIAFYFFRFWGQRWIEGKFSEKLRSFEHDLNKQLASHQAKIDASLHKIHMLQERELDILATAWKLLSIASKCLDDFVNSGSYPNDNEKYKDLFEKRKTSFQEYKIFIEHNVIFLDPEIQKEFVECCRKMARQAAVHGALEENSTVGAITPNHERLFHERFEIEPAVKKHMQEIERLVHCKLHAVEIDLLTQRDEG